MPHLVLTCIWSPPLTIDELSRFFSCTQNTSRTSNVPNTPLSFIFVNLARFPDPWIVANMSSMPSISRILPQPPRPSPFLSNKLMKCGDLWLLGAFICTINANGTPHWPWLLLWFSRYLQSYHTSRPWPDNEEHRTLDHLTPSLCIED